MRRKRVLCINMVQARVLLSCTFIGYWIGLGAHWLGGDQDRDTKDRHNSNLQRIFTAKLTVDPLPLCFLSTILSRRYKSMAMSESGSHCNSSMCVFICRDRATIFLSPHDHIRRQRGCAQGHASSTWCETFFLLLFLVLACLLRYAKSVRLADQMSWIRA